MGDHQPAEDIKSALIQSAVMLFEKYGYHNVKINQITKEIGMTTGAFYYYFSSKEEILKTIYDQYITLAIDMIREICESKEISVYDKLYLLIKRHLNLIKEYLPYVSVYFREHRNLSKEALDMVRQRNDQFLQYCVRLIEEGTKSGIFKKSDPKIISLAILGMNNWLYQWYKEDGKLTIDEISNIFFDLVANGLMMQPVAAGDGKSSPSLSP